MLRIVLVVVLIIVVIDTSVGQQMPIDTSYTIQSAFQKAAKEFPQISIAYSLDSSVVEKSTDVVYRRILSRELKLDIYRNNLRQKNATIFLLHGGGWKSGDKGHMRPLASRLASKGYTCVSVGYRLSPEARFPAAIEDVLFAIDYVKTNAQRYRVDKNRIAILGCSSGGQMATLIGTIIGGKDFHGLKINQELKNSIQAIVNVDGILAFHHRASEEGRVASEWLGGSYKERPLVWNDASALHHTDGSTPPILFINSQYPRFHAGRDDMISILEEHRIYSEVREIDNSPHTFWLFYPWVEETVSYIHSFLEKVLVNK